MIQVRCPPPPPPPLALSRRRPYPIITVSGISIRPDAHPSPSVAATSGGVIWPSLKLSGLMCSVLAETARTVPTRYRTCRANWVAHPGASDRYHGESARPLDNSLDDEDFACNFAWVDSIRSPLTSDTLTHYSETCGWQRRPFEFTYKRGC